MQHLMKIRRQLSLSVALWAIAALLTIAPQARADEVHECWPNSNPCYTDCHHLDGSQWIYQESIYVANCGSCSQSGWRSFRCGTCGGAQIQVYGTWSTPC